MDRWWISGGFVVVSPSTLGIQSMDHDANRYLGVSENRICSSFWFLIN
jgi:hypothetical protein